MSAPACYVVSAGEFAAGMESVSLAILACLLAVWLAGWRWYEVEDRARRFLRRRRIQRIRAARRESQA